MADSALKSFLVSLGFKIDDAGAAKFEATIASVSKKVVALGTAVETSALAVIAYTTKIASGLDQLYFASQRTGATVDGIKAIGYAASQSGSSASAAQASLENLARFIRNNPGAEGFLQRLGVQTRDAQGHMMSMESIFTGVNQRLNQMPVYRAKQYADMFGIDENTMLAARSGMGQFVGSHTAMAKAIGYNADHSARQSNVFMTSMRQLGDLVSMSRDKIGGTLAEGLAPDIDKFTKTLVANFPQIEKVILRVLKGILWLSDQISHFVMRAIKDLNALVDWFSKLDDGTKTLIGTFAALLVAWRVLNTGFLTSPIGAIILLIAAIALLWDDYQTWREGGKSLIDWKEWEPAIENAKQAMKWIGDKLLELKDAVGGWKNVFNGVLLFVGGAWAVGMIKAIGTVLLSVGTLTTALAAAATIAGSIYIKDHIHNIDEPMTDTLVALGTASSLYVNREKSAKNIKALWDHYTDKIGSGFAGMGGDPAQHAQMAKRPGGGSVSLDWMAPTFAKLEQLYQLPAGLLKGVALTESSGNPYAVGPKTKYGQAEGMFQLLGSTARGLGLKDGESFDPQKAAAAAAKYLSQLLQMNNGDLNKALASYNWGIGNVQRKGMGAMPWETRNYIPKVRANMGGSDSPGINQQTTINVYGAENPRDTAKSVSESQDRVNGNLIRNLSTKVK